jgi:DnaJ-class molecular chaperone
MNQSELRNLVAQIENTVPKDPLLKQLAKAVRELAAQIPCADCNGKGYHLGILDKPSDIPKCQCKTCNGTGLKFNL